MSMNMISWAKKNLSYHLSATMPPPPMQRNLIKDLRREISELPPIETESDGSTSEWTEHRLNFRKSILTKNPRSFLRFSEIRGTMFTGSAPWVKKEFLELKENSQWNSIWCRAVRENPIGCPPSYWSYPESSSNLIHHAYSLCRFTEETRTKISQLKTIVEFGGGYGSMCRLVKALGFKGRYIVFDLPEFLALQKYFLRSNNLDKDVQFVSDVNELKPLLDGRSLDLFIATWSVSEAPIEIRKNFFNVLPKPERILIAFQHEFSGINNVAYFKDFAVRMNLSSAKSFQIPHLPNSSYLFA